MPRLDLREWWMSLSSEQKFSTGVLGLCGSITLVLSIGYLASSLHSPFLVPKSTVAASQKIFAKQQESLNALERSKTKDTDRDGLSDYAELYLYRTSPYLADTDSDGIPDAIEVAQGSDPNCPAGQNCLATVDASPRGTATSSFANLLQTNDVLNAAAAGALGANDPRVLGAQSFVANPRDPAGMTAAQIREYLVANSLVSAESLAALSDSDVTILYRAAYSQALQIREAQTRASQAAEPQEATSTEQTAP